MKELKVAWERGRDELAQALKAFPDSIGPSNASAVEQKQEEMKEQKVSEIVHEHEPERSK